MNGSTATAKRKRVLLSGVFGPFGVDDAFGRRENVMELFHNQVTREQGGASFRFHHRSFGLYFIAANIEADTTVLDFPSRRRFVRELKKGYDIVGISFIAPNLVKAREMARLTRKHAPGTTIVVGGHGAAIENVEQLIDCDHVARGEGISWMRRFLGQDPAAPIVHPVLPSADREWIFGVPLPGISASLLVPGLGCVNGCRFCSTSHFFDRQYTPFIRTGRELFETASRIADARGTDSFFVMDENFLKDTARARELLAETERHGRHFRFQIFSSAEAITAFGVDELVRLGVEFVWMGVECKSRDDNFPKNKGIDPVELIRSLRERGIVVLASGILGMEHQTPENIAVDIDYLVGLESDFVQFMLLTPLPTTQLYHDMKEAGLLREDLPFEEWHGQKMLNWRHPHFPGDSAELWVREAFRRDHAVNSSSMYRVTETAFRGWQRLAALPERDSLLEKRLGQMRRRLLDYCHMMPTVARHAINEIERDRALELDGRIREALGPLAIKDRVVRLAIRFYAARWRWRTRLFGDRLQPATIVTRNAFAAVGAAAVPVGVAARVQTRTRAPRRTPAAARVRQVAAR